MAVSASTQECVPVVFFKNEPTGLNSTCLWRLLASLDHAYFVNLSRKSWRAWHYSIVYSSWYAVIAIMLRYFETRISNRRFVCVVFLLARKLYRPRGKKLWTNLIVTA